jgi:uncharacterized protein (TIRG00374 family)
LKTFAKIFISLAFACTLIYYVFKDQELEKIWNEMLTMQMGWLFMSYVAAFFAHWLRGIRWLMMAKNSSYLISTVDSFFAVMLGYTINLVLPRGGELARCSYLQQKNLIPFMFSLGTVMVERIIDLIVMLIFLILSFVLEYNKISSFLFKNTVAPYESNVKLIATIGLICLIAVFTVLYFKKKLLSLNLIKNLLQGFTSVLKQKNPFIFCLYSFSIWIFYFLMMFFALKAYKQTEYLTLSETLCILMISTFGMIVPVPGGTGAYHFLVTQGLVLFGIYEPYAITFATVSHALQIFEILSLFILASVLNFISKPKKIFVSNTD